MNCKTCQSNFEYSESEITLFKKFGFKPFPFCFECHQRHLLSFRNERKLYRRKCDATGESILSVYSPDKPYRVFKNAAWYGDGWDPCDYGQEVDFMRPLFEQIKEIQLKTPRLAILNANSENSDYCNMTSDNKDCYLVFGGDFNENVIYGTLCMHNKNGFDLDFSHRNEWCYFMGDSDGCFNCQFVLDSKNCKDSYFLSDCSNCHDCILCTNLANQSYCIKNKQYSKEEYLQKKEELMNGSYQMQKGLWTMLLKMRRTRPVKYTHLVNAENSSGDYLKNVKNCHHIFEGADSEDCCNGVFVYGSKDTFNSSFVGHGTELAYNQIGAIQTHACFFSYFVINGSNVLYSDFMVNCQDCLGCVSMNHKNYCILNKQYSKEDYEKLLPKVIQHMKSTGEWGQFLSKDLSCYGYNESTAHQYYPLDKNQAVHYGFSWKKEEEKVCHDSHYHIPDHISEVNSDILKAVLYCKNCLKNYRIVDQELAFYKQFNIPIPRICSECRHSHRMKLRNPKKLWDRECQLCQKKLKSTYAPDRSERVLCEPCYLQEVY